MFVKRFNFTNTFLFWGAVLILLFLLSSAVRIAAAEDVVTVATGEWAPYVTAEAGGGGMSYEIVSAAMERAELTAKYEYYPWKRALLTLKSGMAMASFPWIKMSDREEFALYSAPLHSRSVRLFYYRKFYLEGEVKREVENGVQNGDKYSIGVVRGYAQVDQYRKMGFNIVIVPDNEMGMQKLVRGHIALMSESRAVGYDLIRKLFPAQQSLFGSVPAPVKAESLYMLFTRKNKESSELVRRFNQGLQDIKEDGTFDRIVEKYGLH